MSRTALPTATGYHPSVTTVTTVTSYPTPYPSVTTVTDTSNSGLNGVIIIAGVVGLAILVTSLIVLSIIFFRRKSTRKLDVTSLHSAKDAGREMPNIKMYSNDAYIITSHIPVDTNDVLFNKSYPSFDTPYTIAKGEETYSYVDVREYSKNGHNLTSFTEDHIYY